MKNLVVGFAMVLSVLVLGQSHAIASESGGGHRALLAYLKIQPGTQRPFLEAAKEVIVKSRQEPGVLLYNFHQSLKDPQQFVIYELFRSDADLQFHKNSNHVVGFLKTVNPILVPNGFVLVEYR